jgi:GGDEF domain-containing protein
MLFKIQLQALALLREHLPALAGGGAAGERLAWVRAAVGAQVRLIARRITHEVERLNGDEWGTRIPVTLSFGVATGRNCEPGELFAAADHQLSDHKLIRPVVTMLHNADDSDGPHVA